MCRICEFDTALLTTMWEHISNEHKMSTVQYNAIYGSPCAIQRCVEPRGSVETSISTNKQIEQVPEDMRIENHGLISEKLEPIKTNTKMNRNRVVKWSNQCRFKCGECHQTFKSFATIIKHHISQAHKLTKASYLELHGKKMTLTTYHQCHICYDQVVHSFEYISQHLKKTHYKMTTFVYYHKYIEQNRNMETLNQDNDISSINTQISINNSFYPLASISPYVKLEKLSIDKKKNNEVFLKDDQRSYEAVFKDWIESKKYRRKTEICKLCNQQVIGNIALLKVHLKKKCLENVNEMDLRDYFTTYRYSEMKTMIEVNEDSCNEYPISDLKTESLSGSSNITEDHSLQEKGFDKSKGTID